MPSYVNTRSHPGGIPDDRTAMLAQTRLMHTCLTLINIGDHGYVEHDVFRLIAALDDYCGSIHSCDAIVKGGLQGQEA